MQVTMRALVTGTCGWLVFAATALHLAAAGAPPPAPIGQPGCNTTTCGNISVPYPFGIQPGCYRPGFNLTCDDTRHGTPPRLLLGDGSLRVVDIFIQNATMRVTFDGYDPATAHGFDDIPSDGLNLQYGPALMGGPYKLAFGNELVLFGCDLVAKLVADETQRRAVGDGDPYVFCGCASICERESGSAGGTGDFGGKDPFCSGVGCCHVPFSRPNIYYNPTEVHLRRLDGLRHSDDNVPVSVFIAEQGWLDNKNALRKWNSVDYLNSTLPKFDYIPLLLQWDNTHGLAGLSESDKYSDKCPPVVATLCKSNHSECIGHGGNLCRCKPGYDGNPYVTGGCQDVDECKPPQDNCFGDCNNIDGSFECRCPSGTFGDPTVRGGCFKANSYKGLTIGLSVASGPALLLLVLGVTLAIRKVKQNKIKLLKEKYFKQNRGQLLQQLVSQRANIAERMVIPLEEIEKATNNFDTSRKLGGGAHGTVYKGILSDLHVVAIKKSKVTIQREIDEFINEVAILSQINHRNVVKLLGCCLETQVPLLVYEFISNGTLHSHIHKEDTEGSLPWRDRLRIASETAKAIAYLHSSVSIPIIHRDIKSANILLDDALTAKVSDFGASRYIPADQNEATTTAVQGTIGYMDPMYYYTRQMTEMSDVYSFGVVLIELLTRKVPTSYRSEEGNGLVAQFNALMGEGNLARILDPQVVTEGGTEVEEVAALAASCTKYRGEERPTMRQVDMALEAFQATKGRDQDNVAMQKSERNNSKIQIRKRTNTEEGSWQYNLEEEFVMSASYPR